jgi:hypothetical protein
MLLTSVDKLQASLGEATATAEGDFFLWYFEAGAPASGDRKGTKTNGVTTVDILAGPVSPRLRQVKGLTYKNRDTVPHTLRVFYYDGSQQWAISPTLQVPPNYAVEWTDERGWLLQSPSGSVLSVGGPFVEGVFTPTLAFGGGSVGMSFGTRAGYYWKQGTLVVASFQLDLSAKGSSVGLATVGGLPFPASATNGLSRQVCVFNPGGVAAAINGPCLAQFTGAASALDLLKWNGTTVANLTDADFIATSAVRGSITYFI